MRFRHSGDIGRVTEQLDEHMVNVYLPEDDMTIPAFIEDLERIDQPSPGKSPTKAKVVPGKQEKKPPPPPERKPPEIQYNILKSKGIQLAFDPSFNSDGSPREYDMVLINDTRTDWLYTIRLSFRDQIKSSQNGKLPAYSFHSIGSLLFDQLNDGPAIDIDCWRITTQGTSSKQHKTLKIKPKSFFSKQITAPLINRRVHLYLLFSPTEAEETMTAPKEEDIKSYTRRRVSTPQEDDGVNPFHEVVALAEFEPEIDLHIEKLVPDPKKIKPNQILRVQLEHFDRYLEEAIRLGVPRVFIIHGLGEGKLRDAIATRLMRNPDVQTFKNEFHAKYGYGATEVVFE
ncbi:MAG: Smr/MutS family protein [Saprospiraceae bacterium]